jgi:hypothetical protein
MIFGGTHPPLDGIQLHNTAPVILPYFLDFLGEIQYSIIISILDKEQTFPHTWMVGEKISARPVKWFEIGFAQAVLLGGEGAPEFTFWEGVLEVLGKRTGDVSTVNRSNRNFMFDYRFILPFLRNTSTYGEFYFEDCCAHPSRDIAELIGFEIPNISGPSSKLAFEFVRTTEITFRNGVFTSGFEKSGHLLGHPLGPDAYGVYGQWFYPYRSWIFKVEPAWERRGREGVDQNKTPLTGYEIPEDRYRILFSPTWQFKPTLWVRNQIGYEFIHGLQFLKDNTKNNVFGSIELGLYF